MPPITSWRFRASVWSATTRASTTRGPCQKSTVSCSPRATSPEWDHSQFDADVSVVGLGTNDFSPGDDDRDPALDLDEYSAAYVDFVDTLLGYHPDAHVFAMTSHMLGDGWPDANDMSATNLDTAIDRVVEHYEAVGDDRVHPLAVRNVAGGGCGTHRAAEQEATIAEEMRPSIAEVMGWEHQRSHSVTGVAQPCLVA